MKLWTLQPLSALDEIDASGTYRCKKDLSFNLSKADSLSGKYEWLMARMEQRIGPAPAGVEYPVWCWHTWKGQHRAPDVNSAAFLKRTEDKVLLTLEVPESKVCLTDFDSWQVVLNGGFLITETDPWTLDEIDEKIDSLEGDALRAEIEQSWEHVFETDRAQFIQATIWEVRRDFIVSVEIIPKEGEPNG